MGGKKRNRISTALLWGMARLMALLPFWVLYLCSDFLFLVVYYLVRYRRDVVRKNLQNAFPDIPEAKIVGYEKDFYHHLCDYFVETVKTLRMSEAEMKQRMHFVNPEVLNELMADGRSCIMSLGHYGNWEWAASIMLHLLPGLGGGLVYKELHSGPFDELFKKIRGKFGAIPIERQTVVRTLIRMKKEGKTAVVGFLNDQRPPKVSDKYWTIFLNQDTPVEAGMDKIAHFLSMSVVYTDIEKVERGRYRAKFVVLSPDAAEEQEHVITEQYMRALEKSILRAPGCYLWSHNYWKYSKEEFQNR